VIVIDPDDEVQVEVKTKVAKSKKNLEYFDKDSLDEKDRQFGEENDHKGTTFLHFLAFSFFLSLNSTS